MKVLLFKPKNVKVEAFQFGIDSPPDWFASNVKAIDDRNEFCILNNASSDKVFIGDWVLKSVYGEVYSCADHTFTKVLETFERKK